MTRFQRVILLATTWLVIAGATGIYLYLGVNEGHWGAWCSSADFCSGPPELTGIVFVSAIAATVAAAILAAFLRSRQRTSTDD